MLLRIALIAAAATFQTGSPFTILPYPGDEKVPQLFATEEIWAFDRAQLESVPGSDARTLRSSDRRTFEYGLSRGRATEEPWPADGRVVRGWVLW